MQHRSLPAEMPCPRCGTQLELGWLYVNQGPIRWQDIQPTLMDRLFGGGDVIAGSAFWGSAVRVEAMRCPSCMLGVFDGAPPE